MTQLNREDLITRLAFVSGFTQNKYDASRYDSSTGTLYCNGRALSSDMISKAKTFFENQKERYASHQEIPGAYEMMSFYDVGIAAIEQMQEKAVADGGKVVVKK